MSGDLISNVLNQLPDSGRYIREDGTVGNIMDYQFYAGNIRPVPDPHTRIHRGEMFRADHIFSDLANNGVFEMILTTPADYWPHLVAHPALDGSIDFEIYEGPTFTGGTTVPVVNHKLYSANTSGWTIVHTPTVTADGDRKLGTHLPGGSGPMAVGASNGFDYEIDLNSGTSYLYRLTNTSGQTRRGSLSLVGYNAPELPDG